MDGWISCRPARVLLCAALLAGTHTVLAQGYRFDPGRPLPYDVAYETHLDSSDRLYASLESRLTAVEAKLAEGEDQQDNPDWHDTSTDKPTVRFGGRAYGDFVMWPHQDAASRTAFGGQQNYWELRRIRFFAEGEGYGVFDYKLQLEFEPENRTFEGVAMRDIYMGIHEVPLFGYVRFGNFKEPFGLEQLTSSRYITFMERAMPLIALAPERHVGACAYNHTDDEQFTVAYGAFFNDSGEKNLLKERVDDNQGIDIPVRVTWNPIYAADGRGLLHLGLGYVWSDVREDTLLIAARPEVHEGSAFISTGLRPVDTWHRLNTEFAAVHGPFSIQSELFYARTNEFGAGSSDQDFYGGYLYGSWFLTGENRVYERAWGFFSRGKPFTNFWIVRTADQGIDCGWGAWELALRWSFLALRGPGIAPALPDTGAGTINNLTLGVNWYWNPHMRCMFNYIHSWASLNTIPGLVADTDILGMRMQFDF